MDVVYTSNPSYYHATSAFSWKTVPLPSVVWSGGGGKSVYGSMAITKQKIFNVLTRELFHDTKIDTNTLNQLDILIDKIVNEIYKND